MENGFSIYLVFIIIAIVVNIFQTIQKYKKAQTRKELSGTLQKNNNQKNRVECDEKEIFKKLQRELSNREEEVAIEEIDENYNDYKNSKEYEFEENRNYVESENTKSVLSSHYETHKIHSQTEEERLLEMQKSYEERIKQINSKNYEKIFERASIAKENLEEFNTLQKRQNKNLINISIRDAVIYNAILERKKLNYFKAQQKVYDYKKEKV